MDLDGKNYCGLTLIWNYKKGYVDIHMPNYVIKALKKFGHPTPLKPQYAPHKWTQSTYGKKIQYVHDKEYKKLDKKVNVTFNQLLVLSYIMAELSNNLSFQHLTKLRHIKLLPQ